MTDSSNDGIKLRDFGVDSDAELAEIQARLSRCPGVSEVALVPRQPHRDAHGRERGASLTAYVVPQLDKTSIDRELMDTWKQIYGELAAGPDRNPAFDASGWNSSLTGEPYSIEEMEEYVSATVDLMLEATPRSVLDIGCGTGMPLLRVAPLCERYVGLDQSVDTLGNLEVVLRRAGLDQVTLAVAEATEIAEFGDQEFDLIACNSASQHFPGVDYLAEVLRSARDRLQPRGRIVLTDVRDFSLEEEFHSSVVYSQAHERTPNEVLRARVGRRRLQERELMVDPRWFSVEFADDIDTVIEVRPRRGRCQNETTAFHYDVVMHDARSVERAEVRDWIDWRTEAMDEARLRQMLRSGREDFGLLAVPNARTEPGLAAAAKILRERKPEEQRGDGVDPESLIALAHEHGYLCHLSRINARPRGGFDVAMIRSHGGTKRRLPVFEVTDDVTMPRALSTDPRRYHMLTMARTTLIPILRRYAAAHLADGERPDAFFVLPQLPLRDGRLDVSALPITQIARRAGVGSQRRPEWWIAGDVLSP